MSGACAVKESAPVLTSYRRKPRHLATTLTSLALLGALALAGCDIGAPSAAKHPSATPTPTAPPTATVAPRVLYQADFAQRASEWTLPPHWTIANGALSNDGGGYNNINIPYTVTAPTYTLTVQLRVITANGSGTSNQYGILGKAPTDSSLFSAVVGSLNQLDHGFSQVYAAQPDANNPGFATYDYSPGSNTRSYVVQVDGRYINFICGGGSLTTVTSAASLAPARLELMDQAVRLVVESVTITTP